MLLMVLKFGQHMHNTQIEFFVLLELIILANLSKV